MNNEENNQDAGSEESNLDTGGVSVEQRNWLETAITNAGGHITDSGFGVGGADLGYTLDGKSFSVNLKVRAEEPAQEPESRKAA